MVANLLNPRVHRPELDGVRGVAIALVPLWHFTQQNPSPAYSLAAYFARLNWLSWSGVDLFFVLSGFLIGGGLLDTRDSPRYFLRFYVRRACRILPVLEALRLR